MQDGLSLPPAAEQVARLAVLPDRRHVAGDGPPPPKLPGVVSTTAAHVVAAVPLKPAARILRSNPSFPAPLGERLGGVHAEVIEPSIPARRRKPCLREPARRELGAAVSHVLS